VVVGPHLSDEQERDGAPTACEPQSLHPCERPRSSSCRAYCQTALNVSAVTPDGDGPA
jgi:hypothetical protein